VTRAAVKCADTIAQHDADPEKEPHQADWLIIDEFSRAEIDKAIGPLYTALGGGEHQIGLWFGDAPERQVVWIPERFRIIATMNSVDTAYVFSFSQGLTRRFQFIYIGVPEPGQVDDELTAATTQAAGWHAVTYAGVDPTDQAGITHAIDTFTTAAQVHDAIQLLKEFIIFVRYPDPGAKRPGWPLGTAQVVDVMRHLVLSQSSEPGAMARALDIAVADRIVPQMSGLMSDQLEAIEKRLGNDDFKAFERTRRALLQVREAQNTQFA
jgi:hypothetical protein